MDNEFADLESELLQLQPTPVRPEMMDRLAGAMDAAETVARPRRRGYTSATSWTSWKWANWTVAAALVAVMFTLSEIAPSVPSVGREIAATSASAPEAPAMRPVRAARTLVGSEIDGVVELADGSSAERVRDYYLDTIEWRDADGRSHLRWEIPREAVRFVGLTSY